VTSLQCTVQMSDSWATSLTETFLDTFSIC